MKTCFAVTRQGYRKIRSGPPLHFCQTHIGVHQQERVSFKGSLVIKYRNGNGNPMNRNWFIQMTGAFFQFNFILFYHKTTSEQNLFKRKGRQRTLMLFQHFCEQFVHGRQKRSRIVGQSSTDHCVGK